MRPIKVIDEVQLTVEFRRMQSEIGYQGMLQVLYEMLFAAKICVDVMLETKRGN